MIKKISGMLMCLFILAGTLTRADEGMWLPLLLKKINEADMQKLGLKLTADEIYNVNKSSLKDAIVHMGGFCTGEMVSADGLMLTNHHCGFDAIQTHSTVENDYITKGFWAMTREQELPNPGLFVKFLVRIEDVTEQVNKAIPDTMSEAGRTAELPKVFAAIAKQAKGDTEYTTEVKSFYKGNEYYLFVYEVFNDVRLVGAPPSSVGNFGGDTDNWMWPRHTGDFSMFRVYCGKDGKPAAYSKDNVPYKPKHFLPLSTKGLKKDDFTMTFGYPGATDRYLTSYGVKNAIELNNPSIVKIREKKLEILKKDMDADKKIDIMYAAKYAQTANYWKYFIGQTKGLKRMRVADERAKEEQEFQTWAAADAGRKAKYGNVLPSIKKSYDDVSKYTVAKVYFSEAIMRGPEIMSIASGLIPLGTALANKEQKPEETKQLIEKLKSKGEDLYSEFNASTDQKLFAALLKLYYQDVPKDLQAPVFSEIQSKYSGNFEKYAEEVYEKSSLTSKAKYEALLSSPTLKKLEKDPAYHAMKSLMDFYNAKVKPQVTAITNSQNLNNRLYIAALREMHPDKKYAPDANSTMRLSYGQVKDYYPMDAVYYNYFTTADGILEKMDNTNDEFKVDPKLADLIKKKDFGPYGENGELNVCFITNNDITGGNSGSPVINGSGELVGLAFDGNWEAMSGDIAFDPDYKRTICVDIRYVLFIIDKFAGASHLVREMKIVNETAHN
jgi:hypothetical protein